MFLKQLEIDKSPDQLFVVMLTAFMLRQDSIDHGVIAELISERTGHAHQIMHEAAHRATEPFVDWNAKADLGATQHGIR